MLVVPLQAIPAQVVAVTLAGQACQISVYQKRTGLFADLRIQDAPIVLGVLALNANLIVREAYLGFIGDLSFFDTLGNADPDYTGLATRYVLGYLSPEEAAA